MKRRASGQATMEFALLYAGVLLPLTFMVIFVGEMLWIWHSVADFTRDGARYAATHCYQAGAGNVTQYMRTHVPRMVDMDQFISGEAGLEVLYYARDPDTGQLSEFTCAGADCSVDCVPDMVSVRVSSYEFRRLSTFFRLPPVAIPDFRASAPIESAGCDETGSCLP